LAEESKRSDEKAGNIVQALHLFWQWVYAESFLEKTENIPEEIGLCGVNPNNTAIVFVFPDVLLCDKEFAEVSKWVAEFREDEANVRGIVFVLGFLAVMPSHDDFSEVEEDDVISCPELSPVSNDRCDVEVVSIIVTPRLPPPTLGQLEEDNKSASDGDGAESHNLNAIHWHFEPSPPRTELSLEVEATGTAELRFEVEGLRLELNDLKRQFHLHMFDPTPCDREKKYPFENKHPHEEKESPTPPVAGLRLLCNVAEQKPFAQGVNCDWPVVG